MATLRCALEDRIGARVPSTHPVSLWMAEYVGVLLCKYTIGPDGATPYDHLHGRRVTERLCEFGGQSLYHVPGKRRSNLDIRWAPGTYLGTVLNTNEIWVGLPNGNVTRARSVCRLREDRR